MGDLIHSEDFASTLKEVRVLAFLSTGGVKPGEALKAVGWLGVGENWEMGMFIYVFFFQGRGIAYVTCLLGKILVSKKKCGNRNLGHLYVCFLW